MLLEQHQCGACHHVPEVPGAAGRSAPALMRLDRQSCLGGALPNLAALLAAWIVDPQAVKPGAAMPGFGVSPEDAPAMASWLQRPGPRRGGGG